MRNESVDESASQRARRIGSRTAMAAAGLCGVTLAALAGSNAGLVASVLVTTVVVIVYARQAGAAAGAFIAPRPWPLAVAAGSVGGLSSLVVAALAAGVCGAVWGLRGNHHDPGYWWSFIGKPIVAVASGGSLVALLVGASCGLLIRGLIGRVR